MKIEKKEEGGSSITYVMVVFTLMIIIVISLYLLSVVKISTQRRYVDDALTDSVLAALVADRQQFEEGLAGDMDYIPQFLDTDKSWNLYKECMTGDMNNVIKDKAGANNFFRNFHFDTFICYELHNDRTITITTYSGDGGIKSIGSGTLGSVISPTGKIVDKTSAYGKINFEIRNDLTGEYIPKSRECYCEFKTKKVN